MITEDRREDFQMNESSRSMACFECLHEFGQRTFFFVVERMIQGVENDPLFGSHSWVMYTQDLFFCTSAV